MAGTDRNSFRARCRDGAVRLGLAIASLVSSRHRVEPEWHCLDDCGFLILLNIQTLTRSKVDRALSKQRSILNQRPSKGSKCQPAISRWVIEQQWAAVQRAMVTRGKYIRAEAERPSRAQCSGGMGGAEEVRLVEEENRQRNWKRWGPYLAERQWGTVREDYSANGDAWNHLPYENARRVAYRWGEDGLLGWTDRQVWRTRLLNRLRCCLRFCSAASLSGSLCGMERILT